MLVRLHDKLELRFGFRFDRPTIVQGLGYKGTKTQIYTVPPYIPAAFLTVIVAFLSDRYKKRMTFALILLVPSIIGEDGRPVVSMIVLS